MLTKPPTVPPLSVSSSRRQTRGLNLLSIRRDAARRGRMLYLEALEARQLLSGSPPTLSIVVLPVSENGSLTFSAADFENQYTDLENDPLDSIEIVSLPQNGTLTLADAPVSALQV